MKGINYNHAIAKRLHAKMEGFWIGTTKGIAIWEAWGMARMNEAWALYAGLLGL